MANRPATDRATNRFPATNRFSTASRFSGRSFSGTRHSEALPTARRRSGSGNPSRDDSGVENIRLIDSRLEDLARPFALVYERMPSGGVQAKPPTPSLDCPTGRAYLEAGLVVSDLLADELPADGPAENDAPASEAPASDATTSDSIASSPAASRSLSEVPSGASRQGRLRAGAIYDRLSRRACRELRSSHGPNLISAGGDAEVLRIAWAPGPIKPSTTLRFFQGPLLATAHDTYRQVRDQQAQNRQGYCDPVHTEPTQVHTGPTGATAAEVSAAEVAEATANLCENGDPRPLEDLLSPALQDEASRDTDAATKAYPISGASPTSGAKPTSGASPTSGTPNSGSDPISPLATDSSLATEPSLVAPEARPLEALSALPAALSPPLAYTPHGVEVLKEVQKRKSLLIAPIERKWADDRDEVADVMAVRAWKHESLPGAKKPGGTRGLTIPPNVSVELYREIETHLPCVSRDAELRRALVYLKTVAEPDPRSGYLPFHETAVAHIRGAPSLARRHEARVYDLAERLQEAMAEDLGMDISRAPVYKKTSPFRIVSHAKGQNCVQITPFSLPGPLEEAFSKEAARPALAISADELRATVNLDSGNKGRPEQRKKRRERRRRKAERTGEKYEVPDRVQRLQQRLHRLPPRRFRGKLRDAKDELLDIAEKRAEKRAEGRGEKRSYQGGLPYLGQLRSIADVAVPLYKFTGSTLRLAPAGPSIAALPKKMRRAVFSDYLEVDMSSAQLALAASLWGNLPKLRSLLQSEERGWWGELIRWLTEKLPAPRFCPEEHFGRVKGVLKGFTYGLFFGMSIQNLRQLGNPHSDSTDMDSYYDSVRALSRLFLPEQVHCRYRQHPRKKARIIGGVLFDHPCVKELLSRRNEMLSQIEEDGHITGCFGRRIEIGGERGPKSVLAEHMQNAELKVMLPVGEAVLSDEELRFGLWQHDGVTIAPRRRKPWAYRRALETAREALQKGREELQEAMDIPPVKTELTVDYGEEYLR